jgi:hypothetical protein
MAMRKRFPTNASDRVTGPCCGKHLTFNGNSEQREQGGTAEHEENLFFRNLVWFGTIISAK